MKVFVFDWRPLDFAASARSEECRAYIAGIGKDEDGNAVCVRVPFSPGFYIRCNNPRMSLVDIRERFGDRVDFLSLEKKVPLIGFTNNTQQPFIRARFKTLKAARQCMYFCKEKRFNTYEAKKEPMLDFFHTTGIDPVCWIDIDQGAHVDGDAPRVSKESVVEIDVQHVSCMKKIDCMDVPPLVLCSWDLECVSDSGGFPNGSLEKDQIITIGAVYKDFRTNEVIKTSVHQLKSCDPIDNVVVHAYADEHVLINSFFKEVDDMQVDLMVGYNVFGFDFKYLSDRMAVLLDWCSGDSMIDATPLGRLSDKDLNGKEIKKNLSSGAFGDNEMVYLNTPGRVNIDLFQIVKKDMKMESYKLDDISKAVLGDDRHKIDMPPKQIFEFFKKESSHRSKIAEYCARDCHLPLEIMEKMHTISGLFEMANATCVNVEYLQFRGQQIRVYSLLTRKARQLGFVVQDTENDEDSDDGKYQGATVLEPKIGCYIDEGDVVSALDFASLYPSIMRAHTLCASTMVLDDTYVACDGVEYYKIDVNGQPLKFAQTNNAPIPLLLEDLAKYRKQAKIDMKNASTPFLEALYNQRQLSYKVCMNSVYGSLGVSRGILTGLKNVSAAVTATGRQMIEFTRQKVMELNPGSKIVYGDSVAEYTPIFIRRYNYHTEVTTFDILAKELDWEVGIDGKEFAHTPCIQVWSDDGWTDVERFIRHRHDPSSPLVRISTHTGVVDVTEDHSLLNSDGEMVKPRDVRVGDALLHAPLPSFQKPGGGYDVGEMTEDMAQIMGFFCGDGSCGVYGTDGTVKYNWALNNADLNILEKYKELCDRVYPQFNWKIMDTLKSSNAYKLSPRFGKYGEIRDFVKEYRHKMYVGQSKVVPHMILCAPRVIQIAFWRGLYDADGFKDNNMRIDQKSQLSVATFIALFNEMGYEVSLSTRGDKTDIFRVTASNKLRKDPCRIKKMYHIPYSGSYVYDITTANHHFAAGPGKIVVHNTDSVLCILKLPTQRQQSDLLEHAALAEKIGVQITEMLPKPNVLEFEKLYHPYLLFNKKRYAGVQYSEPVSLDKFKVDIKGLSLIRRDSAPISRNIAKQALDIVLFDKSFEKALDQVHERLKEVLSFDPQKDDWSPYIMSKTLRASYKNPESLPHYQVAQKRRKKGDTVNVGERIPFVFVKEDLDLLQAYRAYDPASAREEKKDLDILYYIFNQILNPLVSLFELKYGKDADQKILGHKVINEKILRLQVENQCMARESKRVRTLKRNKQREITSFFSKKPRAEVI